MNILCLAAAGASLHLAPSDQPVPTVLALGALSLLPFAAMMLTSFVKIAVVLSIARSALGAQQLPPNTVITGLAVILSIQVMAPTVEASFEAWDAAPRAGLLERADGASEPLRDFLTLHAEPEDLASFLDLARAMRPEDARDAVAERDLAVAMPAFVISELREAFRIGFLVFLPFLVVDLVVSSVLLALGMHMLSPTTVSLPFKLLLFVAADGWRLLAEALVRGYLPA